MKRKSTLIFVVKKFDCQAEYESGCIGGSSGNFRTKPEATTFSPSDQTVNRILDFAKAYEVVDTEWAGKIEMIFN